MALIGNWPSSIGFRTVDFESQTQTRVTETQSGRTVRFSTATNKFTARIRYPFMSKTEFRPIQAFATRANGSLNSFDIILPSVSDTSGSFASQTLNVTAAASVGASSLTVTSDQNSSTILKAGDVVRFANHTKVYMVTTDIVSNGSGVATLEIFPNLIQAIEDDSAGGSVGVTVNQVPFRMFIDKDVQVYKHATDGTISYEFDVVEDI
jgi:hypothetical protein